MIILIQSHHQSMTLGPVIVIGCGNNYVRDLSYLYSVSILVSGVSSISSPKLVTR